MSKYQKSPKEFSSIIISRRNIRETASTFIEKFDFTKEITTIQDRETLIHIFWEIAFLEEDQKKIGIHVPQDYYFAEFQKSFYNIITLSRLLSHRERPEDKEKDKIKKQYEKFEKSFWQDLEFLNITNPNLKTINFIPLKLTREKIVVLVDELIPVLKEICSVELDAIGIPPNNPKQRDIVRRKYLKPYEQPNLLHPLKNLHAISNYYRDIENLGRIKKYTDPTLLNKLDFNSPIGQYALLRVVIIVGECCSQKNISVETKYLGHEKIDWHAFVLLRDAIVHAGEKDFQNVTQNLKNFLKNPVQCENLKKELVALHEDVEKILLQLGNSEEKKPEEIKNLYKWKIKEYNQKKIRYFFETPISSGLETLNKLHEKIKELLDSDIRNHEPLMEAIKQLIVNGVKKSEIKQEKKNEFMKNIFPLLKNELATRIKVMHALLNGDDKNKVNKNKTEVEKLYDSLIKETILSSENKNEIDLTLDAIDDLESALPKAVKELLQQQKKPFSGFRFFISNGLFTIPIPSDSVKEELSSGEIFAGKIKQITDEKKTKSILELVKNNPEEIEKNSIEYNRFSKSVDGLKENFILCLALDYLIAKIFPCVEKLAAEQKNILEKELGTLWELELKLQRNSEQHFNIPENVCATSREEFLVRYISVFILGVKPKLKNMKSINGKEENQQNKITIISDNNNRFLSNNSNKNQENTTNQNNLPPKNN